MDPAPSEERHGAARRRARPIDVAGTSRRSLDPGGDAIVVYDYLIVATGAAHAYFGHPEWAARAPGLKTLDDALEIRRRVLLAFEAAERETRSGDASGGC